MFQLLGVKETLACAIKLEWGAVSCAEIDCQNKWNHQSSEDPGNDNSGDENDTYDDYQYESNDEE